MSAEPRPRGNSPPREIAFLAGVVAGASRLWTRNLIVAFIFVLVAFVTTMIPFLVVFFENLIRDPVYTSFVKAIEEIYFGLIAITVSSILNYVEAQDGHDLGRICACLTAICVLLNIVSICGYFFVHFLGKLIFAPGGDGHGFVTFTLFFAFFCAMFSMMNILEARRIRDKAREFKGPQA